MIPIQATELNIHALKMKEKQWKYVTLVRYKHGHLHAFTSYTSMMVTGTT